VNDVASLDAVVRGWPDAVPPEPVRHERWPDHALLVAYRTARPGGGALTFGAARLIGGTHVPEWRFCGRGILASEARRYFEGDPMPPMDLEGFLEEAVWRSCYRPQIRAGLVAWSIPTFVSAASWRVDALRHSYRFTLWTWDDGTLVRPNFHRSRIRVTPSSGGRAATSFDDRLHPDEVDFVTGPDGSRHQYRGRFASLSAVGYMLSGEDTLTLGQALDLWGIARPAAEGGAGLVAELDALCALYERMLGDLGRWLG
jgi:hypothetical protein